MRNYKRLAFIMLVFTTINLAHLLEEPLEPQLILPSFKKASYSCSTLGAGCIIHDRKGLSEKMEFNRNNEI